MKIPRIYQPISLKKGSMITLNRSAFHHVIHVLHLSLDDPITIFNGQGGEFSAFISKIEKQRVFVTIEKFNDIDRESPLIIHLAQGIARGEKMDLIIQKATELGVNCITPLLTERCNVKLSHERWQKRIDHWRGIIISACEQCGRNKLPTLFPIISLSDWINTEISPLKIVLHPQAKNSLSNLSQSENKVTLLVGPEGGLSDIEIQMAIEQNFHKIQLGPRILRTETSALAAIAALQSKWGDAK